MFLLCLIRFGNMVFMNSYKNKFYSHKIGFVYEKQIREIDGKILYKIDIKSVMKLINRYGLRKKEEKHEYRNH